LRRQQKIDRKYNKRAGAHMKVILSKRKTRQDITEKREREERSRRYFTHTQKKRIIEKC
jgi:hypothetical protein